MSRFQDFMAIVRGIQTVVRAGVKEEEKELMRRWNNSSVRLLLNNSKEVVGTNIKNSDLSSTVKTASDGMQRASTVVTGVSQFLKYKVKDVGSVGCDKRQESVKTPDKSEIIEKEHIKVNPEYEIQLSPEEKKILTELEVKFMEKEITEEYVEPKSQKGKKMSEERNDTLNINIGANQNVIEKPEQSHEIKTEGMVTKFDAKAKPKALPNIKSVQTLSENAKPRTVPSSRIGRMVSFGSLAAGLGVGTAVEFARRTIGLSNTDDQTVDNLFLNPANTERIVNTLCKVRGAALKIGQILSIQDESIVSPSIAKAFERVRRSADFMPEWQVEKVLITELGPDWKSKLSEIDMKPFAAASIGQVHQAKTLDGRDIAMKIQYPGVAKGINSDIDNLMGVMKLWNIFPEGMFIDNVVTVAKRELAWEVDYIREAQCMKKFKELLKPYPEYYVPEVIDELSTKEVFTTDLLDGVAIEKCMEMSGAIRKDISEKIMKLATLELIEFQYMQTDPNWANFFYNPTTKQLLLIDFGASRGYSKQFMNTYAKILKCSAENDREGVLHYSKDLGFFTGYESRIMEEAHVDAVMALGKMFQVDGEFNFSTQTTTKEIANLVPTMLAHRLRPPPEEIYSLHRKLSGIFLLCSKLKVSINCRKILYEQLDKYDFESV